MNQQNSKMIVEAIEGQRITNQTIAQMIESDERTAYIYAIQTAVLIKEPVTPSFFCQLAALCYYMGSENFGNSIVLGMINTKHSSESVRRTYENTMLTYTQHLR